MAKELMDMPSKGSMKKKRCFMIIDGANDMAVEMESGGRLILSRLGPLFFAFVFFVLPGLAMGEVVRGIYGVPSIKNVDPSSYVGELEKAGVNAVFVPADNETVKWFKNRGFQVYVSVNAFGGKGGWKKYPDSRPVKSNGEFLGSTPGYKGHGGMCPTHQGWRNERLKYIEKLVKELGSEGGIDGVWLDFIRYPGLWEVPEPEIPDTCYCPRCLAKFQQDTGINIPSGLGAKGSASWIKAHALYKWMEWKKAQIASFVSETRAVMEKNRGKNLLKLGLFLVPWTKGEKGDAISYLLAQDAFQLSGLVDVISPMVYHKMCGRRAEWVGFMTQYYEETVPCQVWPIVEAQGAESIAQSGKRIGSADYADYTDEKRKGHSAESIAQSEFGNAVRFAGQGGADGVIGYPFRAMKPDMWKGFRSFQPLVNLIPNPGFEIKDGGKGWAEGVSRKDAKAQRGKRAEDGGQEKTEVGGQRSEGEKDGMIRMDGGVDGEQRTEDGGQRSEVGGQEKTEVGGQRAEGGGWYDVPESRYKVSLSNRLL